MAFLAELNCRASPKGFFHNIIIHFRFSAARDDKTARGQGGLFFYFCVCVTYILCDYWIERVRNDWARFLFVESWKRWRDLSGICELCFVLQLESSGSGNVIKGCAFVRHTIAEDFSKLKNKLLSLFSDRKNFEPVKVHSLKSCSRSEFLSM